MYETIFTQPYLKAKVIGEVLGRKNRTTLTKDMTELIRAKRLSKKESGKEIFFSEE